MCAGVIFSMFLGISLVISCIVDSLNLFGIPRFLLVVSREGEEARHFVCGVPVVIDLVVVRGWDSMSRFWRSAVLPPGDRGKRLEMKCVSRVGVGLTGVKDRLRTH